MHVTNLQNTRTTKCDTLRIFNLWNICLLLPIIGRPSVKIGNWTGKGNIGVGWGGVVGGRNEKMGWGV